jgi:anti-sigma B factor antagonist
MQIHARNENDVTVVTLQGEMDTLSSPGAETFLNGLRANGAKKILLNFKKLSFVSSAGLRVLLAAAKQLKVAGGGLRVCSLNPEVKEVFDITGFSTLLPVSEDEPTGLAGF